MRGFLLGRHHGGIAEFHGPQRKPLGGVAGCGPEASTPARAATDGAEQAAEPRGLVEAGATPLPDFRRCLPSQGISESSRGRWLRGRSHCGGSHRGGGGGDQIGNCVFAAEPNATRQAVLEPCERLHRGGVSGDLGRSRADANLSHGPEHPVAGGQQGELLHAWAWAYSRTAPVCGLADEPLEEQVVRVAAAGGTTRHQCGGLAGTYPPTDISEESDTEAGFRRWAHESADDAYPPDRAAEIPVDAAIEFRLHLLGASRLGGPLGCQRAGDDGGLHSQPRLLRGLCWGTASEGAGGGGESLQEPGESAR
mmetsp:Transcript_65223/g.152649  ORF Transcript_65223/g.152649 Transcript_65223/m.152649 type:complete len:309 (+) Transcript_65223:106-1032(+)